MFSKLPGTPPKALLAAVRDFADMEWGLRKLPVDRPNQVWAADISYIPMARGFVYLVAIIDWFSRKVLAWRLSNSMAADFRVEALEEALA